MKENCTSKITAEKTRGYEEVENVQEGEAEEQGSVIIEKTSAATAIQIVEKTTISDHTYAGNPEKDKEVRIGKKQIAKKKKPTDTEQQTKKGEQSSRDEQVKETTAGHKHSRGDGPEQEENNGEYSINTWIGVGREAWQKVWQREKLQMKENGKLKRRLWLFGDSLLRWVGREIHFTSSGFYKIMDESKPGATIRNIRNRIVEKLAEFEQDDLVVIEGGGNDLLETGEQKTTQLLESMVKLVKVKVKQSPLVICIPIRRNGEGSRYGEVWRAVNKTCLENLEKWACDGLQLHEYMNWRRVWAWDGIHMSSIGKAWMARNVVEWANTKNIHKRRHS